MDIVGIAQFLVDLVAQVLFYGTVTLLMALGFFFLLEH